MLQVHGVPIQKSGNEADENPGNNDQQEPAPPPPSPDTGPPITSQTCTTAAAAPGAVLLGENLRVSPSPCLRKWRV
ncbi:hypothetical protein TNCV_2396421 [Trichonephila clavipes]|uniref:Uncharacterized protein n=1 Tax=Trichonephila clavipes TaxID=2585209 RepID=A0A8X6VQV1_TRICX|nr:hypothetical protein TNCV_2396421 [Trichonephila clavipes]